MRMAVRFFRNTRPAGPGGGARKGERVARLFVVRRGGWVGGWVGLICCAVWRVGEWVGG